MSRFPVSSPEFGEGAGLKKGELCASVAENSSAPPHAKGQCWIGEQAAVRQHPKRKSANDNEPELAGMFTLTGISAVQPAGEGFGRHRWRVKIPLSEFTPHGFQQQGMILRLDAFSNDRQPQ